MCPLPGWRGLLLPGSRHLPGRGEMNHQVVSHDEWLEARKQFLAKEKEFTRLRDQHSQERRDLPWEPVSKDYSFDGPNGKCMLSDLFAGKSQLIVYHLMYGPDWKDACKSCSFWADNFNGIDEHLRHRDTSLVAVSRAPQSKLKAFAKRMGWTFPWYSSGDGDFPYDYQASFTEENMASGQSMYNFAVGPNSESDLPGISVFYKDESGQILHTYSCYSRGIDMMNGAYHYLDLAPKGRDEKGLSYTMEWLRLHDEY
jgi:predicted dithiol-disulfide oxidoreductase (DUF899 family)